MLKPSFCLVSVWLLLLLSGCGGPPLTPVEVLVVERDTERILDSAMVVLQRVYRGLDTVALDTQWTQGEGRCQFAFAAQEGYDYEVVATRRHYQQTVLSSGEAYGHRASLLPGDSNRVRLALELIPPPDPERFERMNAPVPVAEVLLKLKSGLWDWPFLPRIAWEDIPVLLAAGSDTAFVHAYPRHPLSTYRPDSVRVGLVALWLIDAVRMQTAGSNAIGSLMPPSRAPVLGTRKGNPSGYNSVAQVLLVQQAFQAWWDQAQTSEDRVQAARRNPLGGTGYGWM
ncbi:MAG: hypothetical protein OHK0039_23880 [Bacteroidia bacterium]